MATVPDLERNQNKKHQQLTTAAHEEMLVKGSSWKTFMLPPTTPFGASCNTSWLFSCGTCENSPHPRPRLCGDTARMKATTTTQKSRIKETANQGVTLWRGASPSELMTSYYFPTEALSLYSSSTDAT